MKLMTWNVNSIRARLENVIEVLKNTSPDIVALQEIKTVEETFPKEVLEDLGYNLAILGQKSYNGVALLSKIPFDEIHYGLPNFEDEQARFIACDIADKEKSIRIINGYMPNGNPVGTEKFTYKMAWMESLLSYVKDLIEQKQSFILCGDFNIIPSDIDVHDPEAWAGDALFHSESIRFYRQLCNLGLTDSVRYFYPHDKIYSFWDYQGRAREKNNGIRIDHILPTSDIMDKVKSAFIYDSPRDAAKASDHVPVIMEW